MALCKSLNEILEESKQYEDYWIESVKLDFAMAIESMRKESGKSYADLARIMGTSNPYISKVFRGDANLTLESMVKLARAVGCNLSIHAGKDIAIEILPIEYHKKKSTSILLENSYECKKMKLSEEPELSRSYVNKKKVAQYHAKDQVDLLAA